MTAYYSSTSSDVFQYWVTSGTTATGTATIDPFTYWAADATTTTTTSITATYTCTDGAWVTWSGDHWQRVEQVKLTAEQAEAEHVRHQQYMDAQKEADRKRDEAKARAEELLKKHLSVEQYVELAKHGFFTVKAQSGREYQIARGRAGNIYELDVARKRRASLCCHVQDYDVPDNDNLLAQKLHLERNEDEFRKTANIRQLAA